MIARTIDYALDRITPAVVKCWFRAEAPATGSVYKVPYATVATTAQLDGKHRHSPVIDSTLGLRTTTEQPPPHRQRRSSTAADSVHTV